MENKHSFFAFIHESHGTELVKPGLLFSHFTFKQVALIVCYVDLENYIKQNLSQDYFEQQQSPVEGMRILYIWEDLWITKTDLIKQRIQALLGLSKRIYARQTEVIRIDKHATFSFLETNHLQGATSAYYKYALIHNNQIVAVATFSKARTMFDGPTYYKSFELERFANLSGITVVGGLSKLVRYFITHHGAIHLMTYADKDWSNGKSYLKLGFIQHSLLPANLLYINSRTWQRFFPNRLSEQQLQSPDLIKIYNAGSVKFVLNSHPVNK